ncbi:MAG TPA: RNA polymerase sigma factor [Rubricoccaceae bacterium]|nr:RNA polymerase sigma factor [Rubricoccaceae bacterium]
MPLDTAALAAHRHRVYAFALRLTGCREDAADVTQEVLVRLWRHGDQVEEARRTAWTLRVTRNAALDLLRSRTARAAHTVTHNDLPYAAADGGHTPDTLTEAADFRRHLDHALAQLDEPYRSIVILREIEDLPYQDIADALDLPLNTLKVYLHRARRRLRDALRTTLPAEALPS